MCLIIKTRFSRLELKILDVGFRNLVVTNEARPKSKSFEWTVSLDVMTVKNLYDKAHSFPSLLSPSQVKVKNRQVLIFELEIFLFIVVSKCCVNFSFVVHFLTEIGSISLGSFTWLY